MKQVPNLDTAVSHKPTQRHSHSTHTAFSKESGVVGTAAPTALLGDHLVNVGTHYSNRCLLRILQPSQVSSHQPQPTMVLFTELLGDNLGNLVNGLALVHVAALVSMHSQPAAATTADSLPSNCPLHLPTATAHLIASHATHSTLSLLCVSMRVVVLGVQDVPRESASGEADGEGALRAASIHPSIHSLPRSPSYQLSAATVVHIHRMWPYFAVCCSNTTQ